MPRVARIIIYPLKSFDGVAVEQATLLPGGGLQHDRQFALRDGDGQFMNGKRSAAVHSLESTYDLAQRVLTLGVRGRAERRRFHLDRDRAPLERWLSGHFELPLSLAENTVQGFPDDLEAPGPTVISRATLETVAGWFGLELDDARQRFRANIEIDGVEPFWEDHLYGLEGTALAFAVGTARLAGTNPCQRCVVPTRSPSSGESTQAFAKRFGQRRAETLPAWAERSRFNHYYRLAVNTRTLEPGTIRVGDEITILGPSAT